MMNIKVFSRKDMIEFNKKKANRPYCIISINNVGEKPPAFMLQNNCRLVRYLYFDDVEKGENNCIDDRTLNSLAYLIFSNLGFMNNDIKDIYVHCGAGVSRSAGLAAALMKFYNDDDSPIFDNPKYVPNMTVYKAVLEMLVRFLYDKQEAKRKYNPEEIKEKEERNIRLWKKANNI